MEYPRLLNGTSVWVQVPVEITEENNPEAPPAFKYPVGMYVAADMLTTGGYLLRPFKTCFAKFEECREYCDKNNKFFFDPSMIAEVTDLSLKGDGKIEDKITSVIDNKRILIYAKINDGDEEVIHAVNGETASLNFMPTKTQDAVISIQIGEQTVVLTAKMI